MRIRSRCPKCGSGRYWNHYQGYKDIKNQQCLDCSYIFNPIDGRSAYTSYRQKLLEETDKRIGGKE